MVATCGLTTRHDAHTEFYGWPRESRICDGLPTGSLESLASNLIARVRADVLEDLADYVASAAKEVSGRTDGDDGRWAVGYLAALGDVASRVARLRRGETGGR